MSLLCHPRAYSQADTAVSVATEAGHPSPSPNKPGLQSDGLTRGVKRSLRGSLPTKVSRGSGPNIHRGRSSLTSSFIFESAPPNGPTPAPPSGHYQNYTTYDKTEIAYQFPSTAIIFYKGLSMSHVVFKK